MFNTLPDSAVGRMSGMDWEYSVAATSRSGGHRMVSRNLGLRNPRAEKVLQHRLRQIFGGVMKAADMKSVQLGSSRCGFAQPRQNKPAVRREYPDDVGACQQWHSAGADRQGTLTITGSNVRRGTEMPVALSFSFV
jgi:hypothetical protein